MNGQRTRTSRWIAWMAVAAALTAPAATAGDGGATLRNDVAHFGVRPSSDEASTIIRNDQAHFGGKRDSSAPTSSPVQRQSPAPIVVRVNGGFDWISAGVGAAGGLGLLLVTAAGSSALRRRHRVDAAQA